MRKTKRQRDAELDAAFLRESQQLQEDLQGPVVAPPVDYPAIIATLESQRDDALQRLLDRENLKETVVRMEVLVDMLDQCATRARATIAEIYVAAKLAGLR